MRVDGGHEIGNFQERIDIALMMCDSFEYQDLADHAEEMQEQLLAGALGFEVL